MKVLIDTCIAIDFLQKREPFAESAFEIFKASSAGEISGYITAKSATDIYYLMHRFTHSDEVSRTRLNLLLELVGLLDTAANDILHALSSDVGDFEDAVMVETAISNRMDCIITRNIRDYAKSAIPVYTPDEFLKVTRSEDEEADDE